MEMQRFTMEPFESRETGGAYVRQTRRREEVRREKTPSGMGSVYRQTAFCALIVALLIVLELFVFGKEPEAVPASAPTAEPAAQISTAEGEDEESSLGKLQFVSGRVYSVFSSDAQWMLPFSPVEMEAVEDGKLLCLHADAGTVVRSAAAGQVVSVAKDARYGTTVRIYHGNDRESIYYGLGGVSVEQGQPLLAGDTIGLVSEEGILYLAATEQGQPLTVADRFAAVSVTAA